MSNGSPLLSSVVPPGATGTRIGCVLRCMNSEQNEIRNWILSLCNGICRACYDIAPEACGDYDLFVGFGLLQFIRCSRDNASDIQCVSVFVLACTLTPRRNSKVTAEVGDKRLLCCARRLYCSAKCNHMLARGESNKMASPIMFRLRQRWLHLARVLLGYFCITSWGRIAIIWILQGNSRFFFAINCTHVHKYQIGSGKYP